MRISDWSSDVCSSDLQAKPAAPDGTSEVLAGVTTGLPGLTRAVKLQNRAARVGFDWPDMKPVIAKIKEELQELEDEIESGKSEAIDEEFGDFLFVVANLARHLRSEEHTSELQSLMRISYAVFCLKKKKKHIKTTKEHTRIS